MTWVRKTARSVVLVIGLFLIVLVVPSRGGNPINILHSFSGGLSDDGSQPLGSLLLSDSAFYGTTRDGGDGAGTVFFLNVDGSDFRIVHSFEGNDGGSSPYGSLILSGSTLYGTTCDGGEYHSGTIFSVDADGSNFQILHSFEPGAIWSCGIHGSLVISESTLYGMSYYGGSANSGAVFSVKTDGSDFQVLHSFLDSPSDGLNPTGNLTLVDSKLYGMTGDGGSFARGTIFSMDTNGSNFEILHSFGSGDDGSSPYGGLISLK